MSTLWILPVLVLAAGLAALAVGARRLGHEVQATREELDGLLEVRGATEQVGGELRRLRARSAEVGDVRGRVVAARSSIRNPLRPATGNAPSER